ncbi:MAG: DUF1015 domain-containing protein [Dehalococcoidia bacterium]|nr:DUF1015 domain-containing protein [Dehalococcoidia bacterium]
MADVQPFRGFRYNPEVAGGLSAAITPPYDIISPQEQALYFTKSPHNVIRLEFGAEQPGDSASSNKYTRASSTLKTWIEDRVLLREKSPAFYLVESRFTHGDSVKSRWCLIARVRLEELNGGSIRPHEVTMKKPLQDRLQLLEACRAGFSPVMGIFRDGGKDSPVSLARNACRRPPDQEATDQGVTYRCWVVSDKALVSRITAFFADRVLYIADGHHRYETALNYAKQRRELGLAIERSADNFVMMSLMDSEDPGVVILPTHRLFHGLDASQLAGLEQKLARHFDLEELAPASADRSRNMKNWLDILREGSRHGGTMFGLYGLKPGRFHLLRARNKAELQEMLPRDCPQVWMELDLAILHHAVLPAVLGIDTTEKQMNHLEYTRDGAQALSGVDSGDCQLAIFVNPTPVSGVIDVADAGARMPQKSTYFYPKAPAGLVINTLDEG